MDRLCMSTLGTRDELVMTPKMRQKKIAHADDNHRVYNITSGNKLHQFNLHVFLKSIILRWNSVAFRICHLSLWRPKGDNQLQLEQSKSSQSLGATNRAWLRSDIDADYNHIYQIAAVVWVQSKIRQNKRKGKPKWIKWDNEWINEWYV